MIWSARPGEVCITARSEAPDGHDDAVVLIVTFRGVSLEGEEADDPVRRAPDAHEVPHGVLGAEERLGHGLAHDADLGLKPSSASVHISPRATLNLRTLKYAAVEPMRNVVAFLSP